MVGAVDRRGATWKRFVIVLVPVVGLLGLLAYGFRTDPREIRSPLLGRPAGPFSLALFDGGQFRFPEHRGEITVINFWASWCIPCREEAPVLEAAWQANRDLGVVVVGINVQDSDAAARAFIDTFGLTFPNGPDAGGRIAIEYGVYGIPETFIIDRDGWITSKQVGVVGPPALDARIREALEGVVRAQEERSGQYQRVQ